VWRDTADLWPGEDWRDKIRRAISDDALAFIACFSHAGLARSTSYQNEELVLAIEQLRQRRPDEPWLIPVRFDECDIPNWDIGGGRSLTSIQRADLYGNQANKNLTRLVAAVLRILGLDNEAEAANPNGAMNEQPDNGFAITNRWRLTYITTDVPGMAQLGHQHFDHDAYTRPAEQVPPWVRVRAVVACDPLGETPGWKDLRLRFSTLLNQEAIQRLIYQLTDVSDVATWRPRGTHRRSWLQADLTVGEKVATPAASAILFLPEEQIQAGLQHRCAELILHIDFVPRDPITISDQLFFRRPPYWRKCFARSLVLPGLLANWLEQQIGLRPAGEPAAQLGIMLQARQSVTEMVDTKGIQTLPAPYTVNQFTGWAVADAAGKPIQELAAQMMLDLSERVLHLDGSLEEMSGADAARISSDNRHKSLDGLSREPEGVDHISDINAIIATGEGGKTEFKSSLHHLHGPLPRRVQSLPPAQARKEMQKSLARSATKTIAAFLNTAGGTLLIGVDDSGKVLGIEPDFQDLGKGRQNSDGWLHSLNEAIVNALGAEVWNAVHVSLVPYGQETVAVIRCARRAVETWHREDGRERFYIRTSNTTRELTGSSVPRYIREHWST
jgi:hypothetical protein